MKSLPKPPQTTERTEWRLVLIGLGLMLAAALLATASNPADIPPVADKVFVFLLAFLGLGMLAAWVIQVRFDRFQIRREDDEWL